MIEVLLIFALVAAVVFGVMQLIPRERIESRETLLARTFARILEGRREEVLEDMRVLYQQTGQDPGVGMVLGTLLRNLDKTSVAITTHQSLAARSDLEPDFRAMIQVELAQDYLSSGSLDRARAAIEEAIEELAGNERAVHVAETVYRRLAAWDEAYRTVHIYGKKNDLEVEGRLALIRVDQAESLSEQGNPEEAFAAYKKALSVDSQCLPALLGMAREWRRRDKHDKAHALLEKHAAAFREREWYRFEFLLESARDLEDNELFTRPVDQHLEREPRDWRVRRLLALFEMETGEHEAAGENLLLCLEQQPKTLILHQSMLSLLLVMPQPAVLMRRYNQRVRQEKIFGQTWECGVCRLRGEKPVWRCPRCQSAYSFSEREL